MKRTRLSGTGKPFFNSWRLSLLGVFALAFVAYLPSLHGTPVWEDPLLISGSGTGGTTLAGAFTHHFLSNSYYRPLTSASFWLDRLWAHEVPYFYHLTNIALHAATALLVCCLGYCLTQRRLAGVLAGIFFAVQPAQIGAVAWIGGRTDALACFLLVLAGTSLLLFYRAEKWPWLAASVLAFLAAVLTKEQSLALLPAFPLSALVFGRIDPPTGRTAWIRAISISAPFVVCVAVYFGLSHLPGHLFYQSTGRMDSLREPVLTAANYVISFLAPTVGSQLTFSLQPLQGAIWLVIGIAAIAGSIWFGFYLWKRNRALAWCYLCGALLYVPVANVIVTPSFWVAPYRVAETGIWVACLSGAAGAYLYSKRRLLPGLVLAANLAAGGLVTGLVARDWDSGENLNGLVLQGDPHFVASRLSLVDGLLEKKDYLGAAAEGDLLLSWLFGTRDWVRAASPANMASYEEAVQSRLHDSYGDPNLAYVANAFCKQSKALYNLNLTKQAITAAQGGLYLSYRDPDLNFEYGCEIVATNRQEAIRHFEIAVEMEPDQPKFTATLGIERLQDGRYAEAASLLERAANQAPFMGILWVELSDARLGLKDYPGAMRALDEAAKHLSSKDALASRRDKLRKLMDHRMASRRP